MLQMFFSGQNCCRIDITQSGIRGQKYSFTYDRNGLGRQRVPQFPYYALLQLLMNASFPVLNFCNPHLYDSINLELGDKEYPRLSTYVRVLGSPLPTLTSIQHTLPKTNQDAHLCPLLRWRLQVNIRQVIAPNSVILEKRNQFAIILLADMLSFQMAAFFYTAATQTEKLRLNNMTTNLPAKTATAMVVLAAAAAEMVEVGSGRRVWMWRRL
jgi:hypothetical protein